MTDTTEQTAQTSPRLWCGRGLVLLLLVAMSWLAISGLNIWMGELNQDEGWYLYAARQLTEGRIPYRDFAFTQAPMLPLVYSLAFAWVDSFGVLGGRLLTWFIGTLSMLAAVWLAMRAGMRSVRRLTGGICLILIAVNVYQGYFTSIVKTYSLTAMFLCAGLVALSYVNRVNAFRPAFLAGLLLSCAAATRISFALAAILGGLYLLGLQRHLKPWAWLDYALGGLLGFMFFILPFWVIGNEGFRFGVLEYHSLRAPGPLLEQFAYKLGCLSRLLQAYLPAALGGAVLLVMALAHLSRHGAPVPDAPRVEEEPEAMDMPPRFIPFLWTLLILLGLVHLAAPFPYDDYFTPLYPVYCAALAATGIRWWLRVEQRRFPGAAVQIQGRRRLTLLATIWLLCALHAYSSPSAQNWFIAGRDRIWWRLREKSPMVQLQQTAQWVKELVRAEGGTQLLTQDAYLAVEAGLPVPRGLEMGPFSYYADWPRARAARLNVLNRDMMLELLATETNAPIAALSGYSLSINSPDITPVSREDSLAMQRILEERFELVEAIPDFGQASTTLNLRRLKKAEADEAPASPAAALDETADAPEAE